jgi:hypothetical protein
MGRVGLNRMYTPYMTGYLANSLPKVLYTYIYKHMAPANLRYECKPGQKWCA